MKNIKKVLLIPFILAFGFFQAADYLSSQETAGELFEKALYMEEAQGDLQKAIELYQKVLRQYPENRGIAAKAQLHIGLCYEKLGLNEAPKAYQKVLENFPEQTEAVKVAKEKLLILQKAQNFIEKGNEEMKIRQVWAGKGVDILGAASPDGKYLSFTDWNTGDLAIREIDTGKIRLLTNKGSWIKSEEFALFSKWSPDSKQVVCNWYNKDSFFDIRVVGIDGSKPRILYQNKEVEYVQAFDWSLDSKHILAGFFRSPDSGEIGLLSVSDSSIRILKTFKIFKNTNPWGFVFSPDGRYIAYDASPDENLQDRNIFILSADGNREVSLDDHPALDYVLDWSPDGKSLLFASDRTGRRGAWIIQVQEGMPIGAPKIIKADIGPVEPLGWINTGDFYYGYSNLNDDVFVVKIDPGTGKILMPPKKEVLLYEGNNRYPDFSKDGKKLAYVSTRSLYPSRQNILCIRSIETGETKDLRPKLGSFSYPRWSPDGRTISVEGSDDEGKNGIYRIEVQTGGVTPIVQVESGIIIYSHRWSKEGKAIFYTRSDPEDKGLRDFKRSHILVHDFESGQEKVLPGSPSDAKDIDISPDGKYLVLLNREKDRSLRIIPAEGGKVRELYAFKLEGSFIVTPTWTADGRFILFSVKRPAPDTKWDMWRISAEGGKPQKLDLTMTEFRHLSAHPDGQSIAFSCSGFDFPYPEIWVMENFLPKEKSEGNSK